MKKMLTLLMCVAMLIFGAAGALAQTESLEGLILEVTEEGVLIDCGESGTALVKIDDQTVIEGVEAELTEGQYAFVDHNGVMTRSIPPQVTAGRIAVHAVRGIVAELNEGGALINRDGGMEQVFVTLPEGTTLYAGCPVTAYYDGVMTASIPPQVNAKHVDTPSLTGTVREADAQVLMVEDAAGEMWQVNLSEGAPVDGQIEVGKTVTVYHNGAATLSLPAQLGAIAVVVAE